MKHTTDHFTLQQLLLLSSDYTKKSLSLPKRHEHMTTKTAGKYFAGA
jgi:hypothetical protein